MATFYLTLFGGLQLTDKTSAVVPIAAKKAKALLAYLALQSEQSHPRDKLAALLWEDSSASQARASLRQTLAVVRKALAQADEDVLLAVDDTVSLKAGVIAVDVLEFERLIGNNETETLRAAIDLYRGDLLAGFNPQAPAFEDWLMAQRSRWHEQVLEAMSRLLAHYQVQDVITEAALPIAIQQVSLDPLRETAQRALMRLYAQQGQYAAALKQYRRCREVLRRELGIGPEAETDQLYQEIMRNRRALAESKKTESQTLETVDSDRQLSPSNAQDNPLVSMDLSLPGQPSIVVLPFTVLGNDNYQQVLADGLALDIMTRLAYTRSLFVIARGTAFQFRSPSQNVAKVAAQLGVRYVFQGSIQASDRRIRVHAALTDATSSAEIWAEHFDRSVDDIFAVQDDIADAVASAIELEVEQQEQQRALLIHPASLDAWSAYHRGCWHMFQFTPDHYNQAEQFLLRATQLDPASSRAFAALSFVHWQRAFQESVTDREREVQKTFECAHHSLSLNPRNPQAHWVMGRAFMLSQEYTHAVEELKLSTQLNPNYAMAYYALGFVRFVMSDTNLSEEALGRARRLSPYDPLAHAIIITQAANAVFLGETERGAELAVLAASQPSTRTNKVVQFLAAFCHAAAGHEESARQYLAQLNSIQPNYRVQDYFHAVPIQSEDVRSLVRRTMSKLGMAE